MFKQVVYTLNEAPWRFRRPPLSDEEEGRARLRAVGEPGPGAVDHRCGVGGVRVLCTRSDSNVPSLLLYGTQQDIMDYLRPHPSHIGRSGWQATERFDQWGRFLPEHTTAVSLLDRLLHHANVVVTDGDSDRMRQAPARGGIILNKK